MAPKNTNGYAFGADAKMEEAKIKPLGDQPPTYDEIADIKLKMEEDEKSSDEKIDRYDVKNIKLDDLGPSWKEMTGKQKAKRIVISICGILFAIGLLYIFICSLDVLQAAFQLLAGRVAGDAFANNEILNNPMAGLMIGVLATVLLQSSSTSTSIIVTMVGAGVLTVEQALYCIMGANIGTSVTNTIVSMSQSADKESFRRSFAGATVHDMFNWLTVVILLPVEAGGHMLYRMTNAIVRGIAPTGSDSDEPEFLKVITEPLTKRIVKVDKAVIQNVATGEDRAKYPVCMYYCDFVYDSFNVTYPMAERNETFISEIMDKPWTINIEEKNITGNMSSFSWDDVNDTESSLCTHLFTGCGVEGQH